MSSRALRSDDGMVRDDLTADSLDHLLQLLKYAGFEIGSDGEVFVSKPLDDHPRKPGSSFPSYLPVGFVSIPFAWVVNEEFTFPLNYHAMLRKIYNSL